MNSDAPVPYWPAYLPAAAEPVPYWPTPRAEALFTAEPGPAPEWHRELEAEAGT